MPRLLFIIERNSRRFFDYVRASLASVVGEIEVIEDRRGQSEEGAAPPDLPHGDRRRRATDDAIRRVGWAIVRAEEGEEEISRPRDERHSAPPPPHDRPPSSR